jgi:hypothetical protein
LRLPNSLWPALARIAGVDPWPPPHAEQAGAFVKEAITQGLLALAFEDDSLPAVVRDALVQTRAMQRLDRLRTDLLLAAMLRMGQILEGEDFILLKGSDYLFRLYDSPYLRQMADVDILVPAARMDAVHERFRSAGLGQRFPAGPASRLASHHETVFNLGEATIEVHHSFIQRARHRIDYEAVWSRRVPAEAPGMDAHRLSDDDALLYHALGLAIKEYNVPLIRYLDLYLLVDRREGDQRVLAERARAWRTERALYASLRQLTIVFPEIAPKVQSLQDTLLSPRVRARLEARVLPSPLQPRGTPERREQLWRKWQLMDGYRERLGFLIYHAWSVAAGRVAERRARAKSARTASPE